MRMSYFEIEYLDHVAIRVKDLEGSATWYAEVLGLEKCTYPEWGEIPIMMLTGKTGIALFPAHEDHPEIPFGSKNVKIDHFAFRVSLKNLEKAKKFFQEKGQGFEEQDHHYFLSIYLKDPDGHRVELMAPKTLRST